MSDSLALLNLLTIMFYIGIGFVLAFSLFLLSLAFLVRRRRQEEPILPLPEDPSEWPFVTIQLPIYNESYVVERLLDAVSQLDYPHDRFEIQVLDDSTDDTQEIITNKIGQVLETKPELRIHYIHRTDRKGFKAGALANGLTTARGEYVAIFDADFIPPTTFLTSTIPYFTTPEIAVVQTRWGHLNENYSILTRLQAFLLDSHFFVEQCGRHDGNLFLTFNGTAGVWRKTAIEDAGGWRVECLTEDLDLSYRAQMKGYKIRYFSNLVSPAELPVSMDAVKSQQFRWTKGYAETARLNLKSLLSSKLPFRKKLYGCFHLLYGLNTIGIFMAGIVSIPLMVMLGQFDGEYNLMKRLSILAVVATLCFAGFFGISQFRRRPRKAISTFFEFLLMYPLFVAFYTGLSFHNTIAALEGYLGFRSDFVRTPKYNIAAEHVNWTQRNRYLTAKLSKSTFVEGALSFYFLGGVIVGPWMDMYELFLLHVLMTCGFGMVFILTLAHAWKMSTAK